MNTPTPPQDLLQQVQSLEWYHTIDLGNGMVTAGIYDHRPYLDRYGFPDDLSGQTALDIGAASGFFSFELERRGARVRATELPTWDSHDFGPAYQREATEEGAQRYLHQPIAVARAALGSQIELTYTNIYDITAASLGQYDLVFCGSVLIHLTDPIRALWNIAQVTRHKAIIATVVDPREATRPIAHMVGQDSAYCWWIPTRACLELMAVTAGFVGIDWHSEFQLNYRNQASGPYHGILHAYATTEGWSSTTQHRDAVLARYADAAAHPTSDSLRQEIQAQQAELSHLRGLVAAYENGRFMRIMRWLHRLRQAK